MNKDYRYNYSIVDRDSKETITGSQHLDNARLMLQSNPNCYIQFSDEIIAQQEVQNDDS